MLYAAVRCKLRPRFGVISEIAPTLAASAPRKPRTLRRWAKLVHDVSHESRGGLGQYHRQTPLDAVLVYMHRSVGRGLRRKYSHYGEPKTPTRPPTLFRIDQGTAKYHRRYGLARPRHLDRWVVTRPNRKWHASFYVYSDRVAAHMDTHTRANPPTDIDLTSHRDADLKIAVTYRVLPNSI